MSLVDFLLLAIRWCHALGAVAWVGGGVFYLLVLRPAFRRSSPTAEITGLIGEEFRSLINTAIVVLVVTGAILTASRLTTDHVTTPYLVVLAIKIALALYMFAVMRFVRRGKPADAAVTGASSWQRLRSVLTGPTALLLVGVAIFGLADLLALLYESSLAG